MTNDLREFMKGGANIHVKSHYRTVNGKLVYVHDHDKMGTAVGHEAQLHERVQHAKNAAHLMAIDPEDRDTVLKHAGQLGLKPEVKYQGGKIKDHEGQSKAHGFHYIKFDNEEDAKKVHASISAASKGEAGEADADLEAEQKDLPEGYKIEAVNHESGKYALVDQGGEPMLYSDSPKALAGHAKEMEAAIAGDEEPKPEAGGSNPWGEDTVDNVKSWVEKKAKEYGGMGQFTSSPEYHAVYDKVKGIYESYKKDWDEKTSAKTKADMEAAGVKFGDKIALHLPNMMGLGGITVVGTLTKKGAQAVVKFDHKLPTVQGQKSVVWTPSMKKAGDDAADGEPTKQAPPPQVMQFPSGKWGLAGADIYMHEDGTSATDKEMSEVKQSSNPAWAAQALGLKKKVFDSKEEAEKFVAEKMGGEKKADTEPAKSAIHPDYAGPQKKAIDASKQAEESGSAEDHHKAAMAHLDAKDAAEKVGAEKAAEDHFVQAGKHTKASSEAHGKEKAGSQDQLSAHMAEAEKNFHDDPAAAVDALRKGAELAEKHGIGFTHANGMAVDAAWMKKKADEIEAAMPKAPPVDEEYANHAKAATEASAAANDHTKGLTAGFQNGEHTPDKAESTMNGHKAAGNAHVAASLAHKKAADKAPTPELAQHHDAEAAKHDAKADVHAEAMAMHAKQHKKNQAQAVYDAEAAKADTETQTANDHSKEKLHSESSDDHHDGASLHESAAKAHTGMIQHALANGDEQAANEHASIATQHQKKAAYHGVAAKAWKATNDGNHKEAAEMHAKAAIHASDIGGAHSEKADNHAKMSDEHAAKAGGSDMDKAEAEAAKATEATTKFKPYHDGHDSKGHLEAAAAHEAASAAHAKAENPQHAKDHAGWAEHHKTWAAQAAEKEKGQAEPSNPWKGKDHNGPASKAYEAEKKGDIAGAINHYKDAAVIAHHNGDAENAKKYILLVKDLQKQSTQKAVYTEPFTGNPQTLVVAIQSAAIQLHQEKQQVRNLIKAVDTMPSFGKLQKACAQATRAGITGIDDIVAHALGGKQQAAPYLAFLAQVNQ